MDIARKYCSKNWLQKDESMMIRRPKTTMKKIPDLIMNDVNLPNTMFDKLPDERAQRQYTESLIKRRSSVPEYDNSGTQSRRQLFPQNPLYKNVGSKVKEFTTTSVDDKLLAALEKKEQNDRGKYRST